MKNRIILLLLVSVMLLGALPWGANPYGVGAWGGASPWNANQATSFSPLDIPNGVYYAPLGEDYEVLGATTVTNGDFGSAVGWNVGGGWAIAGGVATATNTANDVDQASVVTVGSRYRVTYTISSYSAGSVRVLLGTTALTARSANGTYAEDGTAAGTTSLFINGVTGDSFTGVIDNISVRKLTTQDLVAGNNGTFPNGISYSTDRLGRANRAMSFNAINQYITLGDVLDQGTNDFSVGVWFNVGSVSGADSYTGLLGKGVGTTGYAFSLGGTKNTGKVRALIQELAVTASSYTGVLTPGTWYYIFVTYDRSGDQVVYVNNVEVDRDATIANDIDSADPFLIGTDKLNRYIDGDMSDIILIERVATASERTSLYEEVY